MSASIIWQLFEQGREGNGCKTGSCRIFEVTIKCSGGSTSGLWQHMQRIHEKEHQELKSKSVKQSTSKVQAIKQPTLPSMLASKVPYKSDHANQKKFDKNLLAMMIYDGIPFKVANSLCFNKMVSDLDPRIKIKSRQTYSKYIRQKEIETKRCL